MTVYLLLLLFNLTYFPFMTLAQSEPNQIDNINQQLPKLTTTQQHGHLTHLRKHGAPKGVNSIHATAPSQMTCPAPVSEEEMRQAVRTLLLGLGEDPDREGLKDTPKTRQEFMSLIRHNPAFR